MWLLRSFDSSLSSSVGPFTFLPPKENADETVKFPLHFSLLD
jgi:hypothetical protein